MVVSISDPYHLATYSVNSGGPRANHSVFSSFTLLPDLTSGWVTLTVQGDGIHIMDPVSLQPIASHTLGPSVFFSAPAITTVQSADGKATRRRTCAPVLLNESSSEPQSQEIWIWEDDVSESLISSIPKKHIIKLSHDVVSLLPCSNWDIVVAVSHEGHISSLGSLEKCVLSATQANSSLTEQALKSWIFPRHECGFPTTFAGADSSIIVRLIQQGGDCLFLYLDACDTSGTIVNGPRIPALLHSNAAVDVTLSSNGGFSCLMSSGSWIYYRLESEALGSTKMRLRSCGPPAMLLPNSNMSLTDASLIPLTSSHILLSSTSTTAATERAGKLALELQIWDLNYGVVLTSFSAGLPSASPVSEDPDGNILVSPQLQLTDTAIGYAILIISPSSGTALQSPSGMRAPHAEKEKANVRKEKLVEKKRSNVNVLVIPYDVPKSSTLAAAVLSRSVGTAKAEPFTSDHDADGGASSRRRQVAIVETLGDLVKGSGDTAPDTFWKWLEAESIIEEGANAAEKRKRTRPNRDRVDLPHQFVAELVSILADAPSGLWENLRPIMEYLLLRRHAVVNNMLCRPPVQTGGVVQMLSERGDWALTKRCLFVLPDIPEDEVIRLLRMVVDSELHLNASPELNPSAEDMDIDATTPRRRKTQKPLAVSNKPSWNNIPSVYAFLLTVLGYPLSGDLLRQAIKRHFADIEALLLVLRCIINFMERSSAFDWMKSSQSFRVDRYGKALQGGINEGNKRGKTAGIEGTKFSVSRTGAGYPPLETILSFLEAIMDTSFLSLMQHPEGIHSIARLEGIVKPELELTFHLGNMNALLEPFASAGSPRGPGDTPGGDNTSPRPQESMARRNAKDNAGAVKIYQVEELEL